MSELLEDAKRRKELLKHMILQLHKGEAPDAVRPQLVRLLGQIPHGEVVAVEQELFEEGLTAEDLALMADLHTAALEGSLDKSPALDTPAGHPVDTFIKENRALQWELNGLSKKIGRIRDLPEDAAAVEYMAGVRTHLNALLDVEKHYSRKENLLFPLLEKHGITGPPTVMWRKHDETRALLKGAIEALMAASEPTAGEAQSVIDLVIEPATQAITGMIDKEEQILLPLCLDTLSDAEWYEVYRGGPEIGFCLYDPQESWAPEGVEFEPEVVQGTERIQLPSGSLSIPELTALLNAIPFDITYVDKDDRVRFFTQGTERIFARTRAIIGRQVQYCHPPSSIGTVQKILDDFRSGRESRAAFWIEIGGRFISIEYFAVRGEDGDYLGTVEVSQDLTEKRALEGQRRLLTYDEEEGTDG
jgi:hypothetical protein